jgi:hypothetical protein
MVLKVDAAEPLPLLPHVGQSLTKQRVAKPSAAACSAVSDRELLGTRPLRLRAILPYGFMFHICRTMSQSPEAWRWRSHVVVSLKVRCAPSAWAMVLPSTSAIP